MSKNPSPPPWDEFRNYLLALARVHIGPGAAQRIDPLDLVQQTLLKAQQAHEQFRGTTDAELAAWLRSILANNLKDALRKIGREPDEQALARHLEQSSVRLVELLPAEQTSPSQGAANREQLKDLGDALFQLPEDQRRAVELRYLKGLSIVEIARAMGRSTSSVGGLLQRGLRALRKCLHESTQP